MTLNYVANSRLSLNCFSHIFAKFLSCETQGHHCDVRISRYTTSRLEFTMKAYALGGDMPLLKLKQPDYHSNFNSGGQPYAGVKLTTVLYLIRITCGTTNKTGGIFRAHSSQVTSETVHRFCCRI